MLDSKGKTIQVGAEYVEDYDKVFLTTSESVPFTSKSSFNILNKIEVDACLKNTCILKVSEALYEKVKTSLTKAGIEVYTKDDPFELSVPTLEQSLAKDPTNVLYSQAMLSLLYYSLRPFFSVSSWRTDRSILKTVITSSFESIEAEYVDKNNVYYLQAIKQKDSLITSLYSNNAPRTSEYNYDLQEVDKFSENVKNIIVNNLVNNRSKWLKDYNLLTYYSDSLTKNLFNKFGYNL